MSRSYVAIAALLLGACASTAEPVTSDTSTNEPAPASPTKRATPTPSTTTTPKQTPPTTSDSPIVAEIQRELALVTETHYQHTTHVVEDQGVFDVDCSGFADYVLSHSTSTQYSALVESASSHLRPLAVDFVNFFAGTLDPSSGWTAVGTVAELVPGDLVAWLEPAGAADTGHVMVVRDLPQQRSDGTFLVPVWDSVALPHGTTDSRTAANATGIGEGEIVLFVDDNGAPNAHEWSDGSAKVVQKTALGRLSP